jgi:cytidylate kinase
MNQNRQVVTIDGARGTGKSQLANNLRRHFACGVLEVGPVFRLIAWLFNSKKASTTEDACEVLDKFLEAGRIRICLDKGCGISASLIQFAGRAIQEELWDPSLDETLRVIAGNSDIIQHVERTSRQIISNRQCIVVGREVGTRFFPDALIKILLQAGEPSRTERKLSQLASNGNGISSGYSLNSSEPPVDWQFAKDGFIVDSSTITTEDIVRQVVPLIENHLGWAPSNGSTRKNGR